jgi:parallel beta-helix repeat protein
VIHLACLLAILSGAFAAPAASWADILRVPAQYPTIQQAVDAAKPGDTVLVGPGLYSEIVVMRDQIRVESDPPWEAVIVGEVHFHFLHQTVLSGFRVVSDYSGIHCFGGGDNLITGNIVAGGVDPVGPGITCFDTSPVVQGNIILNRKGIGIYCQGASAPHIVGNTIVRNGAGEYPRAGIFVSSGSSPIIERNIIAWGGGPAVTCEAGASPVLLCNDLFANDAGDAVCGSDGGGNFSLDPRFCDVAQGDLALTPDSPCAAAGACGQVGARGVACAANALEPATWGRIKAGARR